MREHSEAARPAEGAREPVAKPPAGVTAVPASAQAVLQLQRQAGNRAVARLLAPPKPSSRALAMRAALRPAAPRQAIMRDLDKPLKVNEGEFKMNLKTQKNAAPGNSGLMGTIAFHPSDTAPDSKLIKLYQAVKLVQSSTGKDYKWTGADKARSDMQTVADPTRGITGGWWIDIVTSKVNKRTKKSDAEITPYYRDTQPNAGSSQDGSKAGKVIQDASLWDFPQWNENSRFDFETVAKATDTGHVYGSVIWGFTISDASKGEVTAEYASGRNVTLATTDEALKNLDEYYRNTGSSTAPTK